MDFVWNVMAHAQKPDFVFRRNGRVHLNRRRHQFSRLLAAKVCASAVVMLDTPCSEVVWRVLATHCIRQFPPSLPLPCVTVCHHVSTGLYGLPWKQSRRCGKLGNNLNILNEIIFCAQRIWNYWTEYKEIPKIIVIFLKILLAFVQSFHSVCWFWASKIHLRRCWLLQCFCSPGCALHNFWSQAVCTCVVLYIEIDIRVSFISNIRCNSQNPLAVHILKNFKLL